MQSWLKSHPSESKTQQLSPRQRAVHLSPSCLDSTSGPSVASTKDFWEQLSVDMGLNWKIWIPNQQVRFVSKCKHQIVMNLVL